MWRWFRGFLVGALLGTIFGFALGIFLFPYWFPPPEAMETLDAAQAGKLVAKGNFIQPNPNDPVHYGKGGVSVYEQTVFLGEDFEVGPGPDFHVYLVPKSDIRSSSDLGDAMFIDLGRLRAFKGSQSYPIPAGVDLTKYPSVLIWCQQFSVLISPADLKFEQGS
ncbi:MAG: DM13 domain-containing protein [Methyloceanibacter sp.]|uniref:DM13 domain-containing protein n=1 Tax=Methyloceanibacter sp. TaxID=1965321 RepID=UPI003D6CB64C